MLCSARALLLALTLLVAAGGSSARAAGGLPYAPRFTGTLVRLALSGHEPDFDPIYRLVIAARLHDPAPAGRALPDSLLVLSSYLESFSPSTTPILPDLLHPDQPAEGLIGFLQGKAALVSADGKLAYRGSLLAEIFRGNAVHLVVTLDRQGGSPFADPLRLQGIFGLNRGAMHGSLRASGPLDRAALEVPITPWPSWQTVVGQLVVHPPPMIGAAAAPPAASQPVAQSRPAAVMPLRTAIRATGARIPRRPVVRPAPAPVAPRPVLALTTLRVGRTAHAAEATSGHADSSGSAAIVATALMIALVLGGLVAVHWRRSKRPAAAAGPRPVVAQGPGR